MIKLAYSDIADAFTGISDKCDKVIVYEHPADVNIKTTHCHFLLVNPSITTEAIKNKFRSVHECGKGSGFWAFTTTYKDKSGQEKPVDTDVIKYYTKGKYDPKFNKGFDETLIATQKAQGYDRHDGNRSRFDVSRGTIDIIQDARITPTTTVPERRRLTQKQIVDQVFEKIGIEKSRDKIIDAICDVIRQHNYTTNHKTIMTLYESYLLYFDDETYKHVLKRIFDRIYF